MAAPATPPDSTQQAPEATLPLPTPVAADTLPAVETSASALPADSSARPRRARKTDYQVAPGVTWHYEKPKPFRWLLHVPRDLVQYPGYAFRKENTKAIVGIGLSSVALWVADQVLLDWAQDFGRAINLEAKSTQKTLVYIPFKVGDINLPLEFNVPDNLNSTFYYIGDGWTHLGTAAGFMAYGIIKKDNRAAQTASQLGESILSTGIVVQAIKRSTGRQSPFVATKPRGEWHLFPSFTQYQSRVPNFDAYPTGHMATAMATVTVIADNYPEYKFVRPLGYGLIGLLGYSMLNNGVHWASDYPLGIALGYGFAKIAVRHGRTRVEAPAEPGTGFVPRRPQPWHQRIQYAPFNYGPYTGVSCSYSW
ncbi:phosphatase PAP2 family protein [Hymenobacter saemangeumensis]